MHRHKSLHDFQGVNRTTVELKREKKHFPFISSTSVNRTTVELKPLKDWAEKVIENGVNRTTVELKQIIKDCIMLKL